MILIEKKQEQMAMRRNIETRKFRRRLADFLCKRYKVDMGGLDFSSKSELNIIEAVRHKWRVTLASKAAKVMIEWAKKQKLKRLKEETEAKHHIAAFRIQLHWRKFNACVVLPRKRRQLEHQSALTIQRCYRGYRVRCSDELYKLRGFRRIDLMHHSFMEVKNDLMAKCSIVISKCWRMFSAISQAKLKKSRKLRKLGLMESVFRLKTTASSVTQYTVPSTPHKTTAFLSPSRRTTFHNRNPRAVRIQSPCKCPSPLKMMRVLQDSNK